MIGRGNDGKVHHHCRVAAVGTRIERLRGWKVDSVRMGCCTID